MAGAEETRELEQVQLSYLAPQGALPEHFVAAQVSAPSGQSAPTAEVSLPPVPPLAIAATRGPTAGPFMTVVPDASDSPVARQVGNSGFLPRRSPLHAIGTGQVSLPAANLPGPAHRAYNSRTGTASPSSVNDVKPGVAPSGMSAVDLRTVIAAILRQAPKSRLTDANEVGRAIAQIAEMTPSQLQELLESAIRTVQREVEGTQASPEHARQLHRQRGLQ